MVRAGNRFQPEYMTTELILTHRRCSCGASLVLHYSTSVDAEAMKQGEDEEGSVGEQAV